ncbi:MAG: PhoH-like protein [bacterium ADurb.Bin236]|nr:MAG: PhoH-like protein [bacterium ADurb.Bin236]HPN95767.1 PhoH family protein [bacterium]
MDKKRILIPDTNIFINDPNSIYAFPNEIIKIPLEVIEEVDDQKRRSDDVGRNARQTSRILDNLRTVNGSLSDGVTLENGCNVSVEFGDKPMSSLPASLRSNKEDNRILATALSIQDKNPGNICVFITLDINMRIKAEAIGLVTMDYEPGKIQFEELYKGYSEKEVSSSQLDELASKGKLVLADTMRPHELVALSSPEAGKTANGRFDAEAGAIVPLKHSLDAVVSGIKPLNIEQLFAFELLMDDSVSLVTLNGRAGTGKTLIALAAGCHAVLERGAFERLLISRPVVPMGKDLGFLPGSIEEKMDPWMQPLYDNLDLIFTLGAQDKKREKRKIRELVESTGMINIEPLTYIRGRSLPNQFMIVDEAQNLSQHEVKTIITRAGKNTKVVLTGDPYQIDHPYLDTDSNGLNYVVERFKDSPAAGHVTLVKGERSKLAELAAELL